MTESLASRTSSGVKRRSNISHILPVPVREGSVDHDFSEHKGFCEKALDVSCFCPGFAVQLGRKLKVDSLIRRS